MPVNVHRELLRVFSNEPMQALWPDSVRFYNMLWIIKNVVPYMGRGGGVEKRKRQDLTVSYINRFVL